ncbi:MAG TPA: ABC transporter permease [Pirellulaceae bacterium]|nr:ABC transporter permease [Pirellulaceae bacterium]
MQLVLLLQTVRLGLKSLALHRLRSSLTVLGIVFGVGSVIVMLAIGEGARHEAIQQIQQLGATNIILRSVRPTTARDAGESVGAVRYGLTSRDIRHIGATLPSVVNSVASREHRRSLRRLGYQVEGRLVGVTPAHQELNRLRLASGRFISVLDVERVSSVAVLGYEAASALFPLERPLGKTIRVGEDRYFTVIGVTLPATPAAGVGSSMPAQDYNRDVYIPFSTDQRRFGEIISFDRSGGQLPEIVEISQINLAVDEMRNVKQTAQHVRDILNEYHTSEDTAMTVPLELLERVERTQRVYTLVLSAIASISLLVGGIGIMNIMLATVTERTREIGIRRALGATRNHIVNQFLVETIVLSLSGGLIGLTAGVVTALMLQEVFDVPTIIRWWAPVLAMTISFLVGVVFGAYPARRAAYMDPIEALRHD